jgi:hypothetical protein
MRKLIVLVGLVVWCSSASAGTPKCEPEELVTIEQCRADGGDKSTAPRVCLHWDGWLRTPYGQNIDLELDPQTSPALVAQSIVI